MTGLVYDFGLLIASKTMKNAKTLENNIDGIARGLTSSTKTGKKFIEAVVNKMRKAGSKVEDLLGGFGEKGLRASMAIQSKFLSFQEKYGKGLSKTNGLLRRNRDLVSYAGRELLGVVRYYGLAAIGLYSFSQAMQTVISWSNKMDEALKKGRVAFGGYTNALAAFNTFQERIAKGELFGSPEEYVQAAQILMRKGIQFSKQMTNMVNDWAEASGKSRVEVANAIEQAIQGNLSAFEDFGITQRAMKRFEKYQGDTKMMTEAILGFMKQQKQFIGAAMSAPKTYTQIWQRFKAIGEMFMQSIFGTHNDPQSLHNTIKRSLTDLANFINKHYATIRKVGGLIGNVLKWVWSQVVRFAKFIGRQASGALDSTRKYLDKYRERVAGIILWLELATAKVVDFFKRHGDLIKTAIKWFLLFKVARWALMIPGRVLMSMVKWIASSKTINFLLRGMNAAFSFFAERKWWIYIGYMQDAFAKLAGAGRGVASFFTERKWWVAIGYVQDAFVGLRSALAAARVAMIGFNVAALANPIGLIVIAVIALIAWVVYLVKNWEAMRVKMQEVSDGALYMLSAFAPIIGIPLLMAKHWNKFKTIFINIYITIRNYAEGLWLMISRSFTSLWESIKSGVKSISTWLTDSFSNLMPDWLKDFGGWIYDSLVRVGSKIKDWFANLLPDWFKEGIGKILEWLSGATENMANSSAEFLKQQRTLSGVPIGDIQSGATYSGEDTALLKRQLDEKEKKGVKSPLFVENPATPSGGKDQSFASEPASTVNQFNEGAIQIIVKDGGNPAEIRRQLQLLLKEYERKGDLKGN